MRLMIPSSAAQYRIRYKQCTYDKNHQGQSLNFVCLNPQCAEKSLICSMCRNDQHMGHVTRPLKHYIETLKNEYTNDSRNFQKQFDSLEESRTTFLLKLKQTVEKVADQFRKLEEEVMERYNLIRAHIADEQSKRNKFPDFYDSLIRQNGDKSEFLIQNYLPAKRVTLIDNISGIEKLGEELSKVIYSQSIMSGHPVEEKESQQIDNLLKLAVSVTKTNNFFCQTDLTATAQSINVLTVDLLKDFKGGKIKIRVTKLKKGGLIHLGAIKKDFFETLGRKSPQPWNGPKSLGNLHYYNNQSNVYGESTSQLKTFSQGSNMQISMNGDVMKIGMKKNSAQFKIGPGVFYFFFNLIGTAEIEMKYLPGK